MSERLKDHILGGLYGQALGDAWGMPAYFNPDMTQARFGDLVDRLYPAPDDHEVHAGLPVARITDDSEQAFSLARAFLQHGGVSVPASVEAIVAWYDRVGGDHSPYVGPSTRRGVQALKRGEDPYKTGLFGDTNGASMRVSVVGLLHPSDPIGAIEDAYLACVPTHHTDVAISGACAVASAIAVALRPDATLDSIIAAGIMGAELGRQRGRKWLGPSTSKRIEMAVSIARQAQDPLTRIRSLYDTVGSSLSTPETVGSAFGVLVMAQGDPVQTAIYGATLSGDADTVAAIACAIAGAWRGKSAIPADISAQFDADPVFQSYDVPALAQGIYQLVQHKA